MPKKKKTRQQKILADKRRDMQNTFLYSLATESFKTQAKQPIAPIKQTAIIKISSYEYLSGDLRKTAIFTGLIVFIEILLKFFTK